MKALIVYESIFGNTQAVAEAIARGVSSKIEVSLVEVGSAPSSIDVELLIVGGPTHAFTMSGDASRTDARQQAARAHVAVTSNGAGIREWIATLPGSPGFAYVAAFDTVVDTKWLPTGSAARKAAALLRRLGYEELTAPRHFKVRGTSGPLVDGELGRAEQWGADLARRLFEAASASASRGAALSR